MTPDRLSTERASSGAQVRTVTIRRMPHHYCAVDQCFTNLDEARTYARRRLAQLERRPPHRVEVEAAVITCPWGRSCTNRRVDDHSTLGAA